jgi:tRNA(Ile)-lysidine synthase
MMSSTTDLLDRIETCLARYARATGVIAISGGPDSVALARALVSLQERGKVGDLVLAHFNHRLRGAESDEDEAFVEKLAEQLGQTGAAVRFRSDRADTRAIAQSQGENLESCARRLRYDWLAHVAREEHAAWVATGHPADDQAETVLFRLFRGTGLQGLAGIPERRELTAGIDLVRPLLHCSRAEVSRYLQQLGQAHREDNSNWNLDFTRNRIRHELLPHLAQHYNPAIVPILTRLADQAREVHELVAEQAAKLLRQAERPRAGDLVIVNVAELVPAAPALVRELFRVIWNRERWPAGQMNFADWERLAGLAHVEADAFDLPGGVRARRTGHVVQLGRSEAIK